MSIQYEMVMFLNVLLSTVFLKNKQTNKQKRLPSMKGIFSAGEEELTSLRGSVEKEERY